MGLIQKPYIGIQLNQNHLLARDLVGCWVMNEATGDKVFDLSGNGNHGTLTNSPAWSADGLYFNATADRYVDIGKPIIPIGDFTIVSYVNATDYVQYRGIVSQYGSGQTGRLQYTAEITTGNIWFQITGILESNTPIGTGSLHQCIVTRNGSTVSFYLDGMYDGGGTNSTAVYQGANTLIGHSGTNRWFGTIAYTMIYSRGFSAEEATWLNREHYAMFQHESLINLYPFAEVPSGWTGEIISLTNPSEILGRATSGISEVNGI